MKLAARFVSFRSHYNRPVYIVCLFIVSLSLVHSLCLFYCVLSRFTPLLDVLCISCFIKAFFVLRLARLIFILDDWLLWIVHFFNIVYNNLEVAHFYSIKRFQQIKTTDSQTGYVFWVFKWNNKWKWILGFKN